MIILKVLFPSLQKSHQHIAQNAYRMQWSSSDGTSIGFLESQIFYLDTAQLIYAGQCSLFNVMK